MATLAIVGVAFKEAAVGTLWLVFARVWPRTGEDRPLIGGEARTRGLLLLYDPLANEARFDVVADEGNGLGLPEDSRPWSLTLRIDPLLTVTLGGTSPRSKGEERASGLRRPPTADAELPPAMRGVTGADEVATAGKAMDLRMKGEGEAVLLLLLMPPVLVAALFMIGGVDSYLLSCDEDAPAPPPPPPPPTFAMSTLALPDEPGVAAWVPRRRTGVDVLLPVETRAVCETVDGEPCCCCWSRDRSMRPMTCGRRRVRRWRLAASQ